VVGYYLIEKITVRLGGGEWSTNKRLRSCYINEKTKRLYDANKGNRTASAFRLDGYGKTRRTDVPINNCVSVFYLYTWTPLRRRTGWCRRPPVAATDTFVRPPNTRTCKRAPCNGFPVGPSSVAISPRTPTARTPPAKHTKRSQLTRALSLRLSDAINMISVPPMVRQRTRAVKIPVDDSYGSFE